MFFLGVAGDLGFATANRMQMGQIQRHTRCLSHEAIDRGGLIDWACLPAADVASKFVGFHVSRGDGITTPISFPRPNPGEQFEVAASHLVLHVLLAHFADSNDV